MNEPLLSIILPVYNGEAYLLATLASIVRQNELLDYELLLIDDGSTDASLSVCYLLAESNPRVRVFHQTNRGIASARNYGLQQSCGQYIVFFDQDDICLAAYSPFLQRMEQIQADILIADYSQGTVSQHERQQHVWQSIVGDSSYAHALVRHLVSPRCLCSAEERRQLPSFFGTIWNCIFRASFIRQHRLTVRVFFHYEDDWVFVINCLSHAEKVVLTPDVFYCHVVNPSSESYRHTFLPHFQHGRDLLWQWLSNRLERIDIKPELIDRAHIEYQKDTELWGFYNCCHLPLQSYLKVMHERSKLSFPFGLMSRYVAGPVEFFFLLIIHLRLYCFARFVNRCIFHLSYH